MKRTIIPKSRVDRVIVMLGILSAILIPTTINEGDYLWTLIFVVTSIVTFVAAYVFQDQVIPQERTSEYAAVIETILKIRKQLSILSKFLEKEQARIANTKATIKKLNDEKAELEPLVHEQREIVEAILEAHSARTARSAWKERLFGFILGVISSVIASFVYEYLK